jgi:hypothetical protein
MNGACSCLSLYSAFRSWPLYFNMVAQRAQSRARGWQSPVARASAPALPPPMEDPGPLDALLSSADVSVPEAREEVAAIALSIVGPRLRTKTGYVVRSAPGLRSCFDRAADALLTLE